MATGDLALGQEQGELSAENRVANDFSINVATVNGSGSQSVEHCRTTHLVYDSRQQRRLCSPQARF